MRKVFLKINGLSSFDKLFSNKVFVNGKFFSKFKGDEFLLEGIENSPTVVHVDFFGGLYSSECEIPSCDKPCAIVFENKQDNIFKRIVLGVILVTVIEVVFVRVLPIWLCYTLLFGSFLVWGCMDLAKRKKKFIPSITIL